MLKSVVCFFKDYLLILSIELFSAQLGKFVLTEVIRVSVSKSVFATPIIDQCEVVFLCLWNFLAVFLGSPLEVIDGAKILPAENVRLVIEISPLIDALELPFERVAHA